MPTITCDPDAAADRLRAAGVSVKTGNTDHERWRAERGAAVAVAYDDKVEVQGGNAACLSYTAPSPRDLSTPRMPSSA